MRSCTASASLATGALICLLSGCTAGGLDALTPEVKILDLEPEEGPLAGGTPVTITGFGFEGQVVAWFGDTPLPTTIVDDLTLVITTPASEVPGPVDVTVSSDHGSAVMEGGFVYELGAGTGSGTGSGTGGGTGTGMGTGSGTGTGTGTATGSTPVAPTGLTGGLVQYVLTQVACMTCFPGWYTTDVDVWTEAVLHDGVAGSWLDPWPAVGTCVNNPTGSTLSVTRYDAGSTADLITPGRTVGLSQQFDASGPFYSATGLTLGDFVHPAAYELTAPGGADLGALSVPAAISTPEGFTTIEPLEMLYVSNGFQAQFSRTSGRSITWSPTGFDLVSVVMGVYSSDGATTLGAIHCVDNDDGSLTVPASVLGAYPQGSLLSIYLYRTQTSEVVIPLNGHTLEGVGQMGVLGTGIVSP